MKPPAPPSRLTNGVAEPPKTALVHTSDLTPEYAWLETLRPYYRQLVSQAQHDRDPAVVAEFALTQMDETTVRAIGVAAVRPDFLETMRAELAPIVASYPEWVNDFLARVVELATVEEEETDTATTEKKRNGTKSAQRSARP